MTQRPIIILCGLSGTGKTYTSNILKNKLPNYHLLGPGQVRQQLGITSYSRKDTPKILANIIEQIEKNHQNNIGSILDANLKSVDVRQFFYDLAKHLSEEVIVIEHSCSEKIAHRRMQERTQTTKAENPKNKKVHELQKKVWQDTLLDLELPENNHVSLIRFDTEKNNIHKLRVNNSTSLLVKEITSYLITKN